jgi:hypothetical protein
MSRGLKLLIGAATLVPILEVGAFLGLWISMVLGLFSGPRTGAWPAAGQGPLTSSP